MAYELVELSTGNLVGAYDTEQAALHDVAESIRRYGHASVDTLALGADDPSGNGRVIAQGAALAARALAVEPAERSRPARRRGQAGAAR